MTLLIKILPDYREFISKLKKKRVLFLILIFLNSCSINIMNNEVFIKSSDYPFSTKIWDSQDNSEILIFSIHGYNDYSNSFHIPSKFLSKFKIKVFSFDLRGFGNNKDFGRWFPLKVHLNDINFLLNKIIASNPNKRIFLMGESMGGAIALSFITNYSDLPIEGIIMVSPALWNFSETNPTKSFILDKLSYFFPELRLSGKGLINIRPSDNLEMLKKFSKDPFVVKKPSLKSINGIVRLMDQSYKDAQKFFKDPQIKTLIIIPIIDEIIPRKPIIDLLNNNLQKKHLNTKVYIGVYETNFHMILRDIDGLRIVYEIKEWILNEKNTEGFNSFNKPLKRLKDSKFFHISDN